MRTSYDRSSAMSVTANAMSIPVPTAKIVDVYLGRKPKIVSRRRPTRCPTRSPTYATRPATSMSRITKPIPGRFAILYTRDDCRSSDKPISVKMALGVHAAIPANHVAVLPIVKNNVEMT